MKETLTRKIESETLRDGLIIVSAFYGKLPRDKLSRDLDDRSPYRDFTIVLQTMVVDSKLHIAGGHSLASIVGFFDPCLGEDKRLRVTYRYKNRLHEVEVFDEDQLILPLRAHLVSE